jgi:hypothetical protein
LSLKLKMFFVCAFSASFSCHLFVVCKSQRKGKGGRGNSSPPIPSTHSYRGLRKNLRRFFCSSNLLFINSLTHVHANHFLLCLLCLRGGAGITANNSASPLAPSTIGNTPSWRQANHSLVRSIFRPPPNLRQGTHSTHKSQVTQHIYIIIILRKRHYQHRIATLAGTNSRTTGREPSCLLLNHHTYACPPCHFRQPKPSCQTDWWSGADARVGGW